MQKIPRTHQKTFSVFRGVLKRGYSGLVNRISNCGGWTCTRDLLGYEHLTH
jgi:hypothetical protein